MQLSWYYQTFLSDRVWLACLTFEHSWAWTPQTHKKGKKKSADCFVVNGRYEAWNAFPPSQALTAHLWASPPQLHLSDVQLEQSQTIAHKAEWDLSAWIRDLQNGASMHRTYAHAPLPSLLLPMNSSTLGPLNHASHTKDRAGNIS